MDRTNKMSDDLLKKERKKRKKKSKELFEKNSNYKNINSSQTKPKTFKQKFNKKYNQPLNKSNSLDEISNLTGFKKSGLKKIIEKGEGAYKSNPQSVRPQVKSATQWGIARLYSAVMKGGAYKMDKNLLVKK
tara:strand:+ start:350 stop:745 length:396 start_codon:yes stop_codon:yes gene_type:complete